MSGLNPVESLVPISGALSRSEVPSHDSARASRFARYRGIRQMGMQACPLGSLLAHIAGASCGSSFVCIPSEARLCPATMLFSRTLRVSALGNPRANGEAGSLVPLGAPAIRREPVLEKASVAQDTAPTPARSQLVKDQAPSLCKHIVHCSLTIIMMRKESKNGRIK